MDSPRVKLSIITAVYNNARFIGECIENVLSQKCGFVEHIIIDGGSDDGTKEIIQKYAQKHRHLRWISEKDTGQSHAINKGIELAQGDIIGLLNVDDYYEPEVFFKIMSLFERAHAPAIIVGNCNVWDESERKISVNQPSKLGLEDLLLGFHVNPFPINPSAYFYHASLHDIIGLYNPNEHYVLDVDFLFRAVNIANVDYVNEVFGNYRMLPGTKTVQSIESGQSSLLVERLIRKYRQELPFLKQIELALKYNVFKFIRRGRGWQNRASSKIVLALTNVFEERPEI
jgi:glycosyltransferase involved in cell wall biosynthesis